MAQIKLASQVKKKIHGVRSILSAPPASTSTSSMASWHLQFYNLEKCSFDVKLTMQLKRPQER